MALTWTHKDTAKLSAGQTFEATTSSSDEKLVVVLTYWENGTNDTYNSSSDVHVQSVTFDGTSLTFDRGFYMGPTNLGDSADEWLVVEYWYLDNPGAVTNGTVAVTYYSKAFNGEPTDDASFVGVINGGVATGGSTLSASAQVEPGTSVSDSFTASGAGIALQAISLDNNTNATPNAGWTQEDSYSDGSLFRGEYSSQVISGSGSVTCEYTFSSDEAINGAVFWPEASSETVVDVTNTVSITLTEYDATVSTGVDQAVDLATLTLTEYAPAVASGGGVTVDAGSITFTSYAPVVATSANVDVDAGSITLTTYDADVVLGAGVTVDLGTITLTTFEATVQTGTNQAVDLGTITFTAYDPGSEIDIPVDAGNITLTTFNPNVGLGVNVVVDAEFLGINALDATISTGVSIAVDAGSVSLTTYDATIEINSGAEVEVDLGTINFTSFDPAVGTSVDVSVDTGSVSLTAYAPVVGTGVDVDVDAGSLSITTNAATLLIGTTVLPDVATISISTADATLYTGTTISLDRAHPFTIVTYEPDITAKTYTRIRGRPLPSINMAQ